MRLGCRRQENGIGLQGWLAGVGAVFALMVGLGLAGGPSTLADEGGAPNIGPGTKLSGVKLVVKADGKAVASLTKDFVLPAGKWTAIPGGKKRYVGKLAPIPVKCADGMTFKMTPSISVTTAPDGSQAVRFVMAYFGRNNAGKATTDFSATLTFSHTATQGCLHGETLVTLHDGTRNPIRELLPGHFVLNPVTGQAVEVRGVVKGPESGPLIAVVTDHTEVWFSSEHPVVTRSGLARAADLAPGHSVLDGEHGWHKVLAIRPVVDRTDPDVYNLELAVDSTDPLDHMILAGDLVVGDAWLQRTPSLPVRGDR